MVSFQTILYTGIAFNLALVSFIIFLVKRTRTRQQVAARARRQQLIEQGKIISAQENLLKSKQELLKEKDDLLDVYRRMSEHD